MKIRMTETKDGSPNGYDVETFLYGKTYTMNGIYRGLAEVFLAEGWAELTETEDDTSTPNAATDIIITRRDKPESERDQLIGIVSAIKKLDTENEADFNASGAPTIKAVERELGWKPTRRAITEAINKINNFEDFKDNLDAIDLKGKQRAELNDIASNLQIKNPEEFSGILDVKNAIELRIEEIKAAKEIIEND